MVVGGCSQAVRGKGGGMSRVRRAMAWLFRDRRTGRIVIAQWPNLPLWIFFASSAVKRFVDPGGAAGGALEVVRAGSLGWWSVDEVWRGVNPFRRILGAVVLTGLLAGLGARLSSR